MRRVRGLVIACLAAPLLSTPAAAQLSDVFPWLTPKQEAPAPRRAHVALPVPAPLPPVRPARDGDGVTAAIPRVHAASVPVPDEIREEIAKAAAAPAASEAEAEPDIADEPALETAADEPADKNAGDAETDGTKTVSVPLPPVRPERAEDDAFDPGFPEVSAEADCRLRLKVRGVQFEEIGGVGSGRLCGVPSAIRVTALSPSDRLSQPATLNCRTAEAMTDWYFQVVGPAARRHFGASPAGLRIAASYDCRNRNGGPAGPISEHAFGNAVDVSAILFRDRKSLAVQPFKRGWKDGFFLREINAGACAMFTTVLGPQGDASHHDHFHFDMKQRKSGYELCQ